ncbi:MAG: NADH-quinone oxidoreductase subunit N, partial [Planctomycetota bacterium]
AAAAGSPAFLAAVVLVFAGLAYKIAAVPFQFWCPDVYQGAPTSVAGFLAVAGKGAGLAALIRFVHAVTGGGADHLTDLMARHNDVVRLVLVGMSIATMTFGNLAALRQRHAKRLLAYSAIAHAGYLLMGVTVTSSSGATAILFYMGVYLFMTLGAFFMVALVERETGGCDLSAFDGLGFRSPFFAVCFAVVLVSLTGLPPTGGFWAKVFLFEGVFSYGGAHGSSLYHWFGVIGLLNGVVSLAYYARFLRAMYLAEPDRNRGGGLALAVEDRGLVFAMAAPLLVLGVLFAGLYEAAQSMTRGLFG